MFATLGLSKLEFSFMLKIVMVSLGRIMGHSPFPAEPCLATISSQKVGSSYISL